MVCWGLHSPTGAAVSACIPGGRQCACPRGQMGGLCGDTSSCLPLFFGRKVCDLMKVRSRLHFYMKAGTAIGKLKKQNKIVHLCGHCLHTSKDWILQVGLLFRP